MNHFLVFVSFLIATVVSYEVYNDPTTSFGSCQEARNRDPTAADGYYYINNNGLVEPYLTFCFMTINGGGWTLFYKNSNEASIGLPYAEFLKHPQSFLSESSELFSDDVVGVSPINGFEPMSLMAVPVESIYTASSVVHFENVDVTSSIITLSDLIEGCNTYETEFTLSETNKPDLVFSAFSYENGTFSFRSCDFNETIIEDIWLGPVNATESPFVVSCGGIPSSHCMYFLREQVNLGDLGDGCSCPPAGNDNMIWPATACNTKRVINCYEKSDTGSISRQCGVSGQWNDFIEGSCTCSATTAFDTEWPATPAGQTAHVVCANAMFTRDRLCMPNGEWDDVMTGGCSCEAETSNGLMWSETNGGSVGEVLCAAGAEGSAYKRTCSVDGVWNTTVTGGCSCPRREDANVVWEAAVPLTTQTAVCDVTASGSNMTRTCSVVGSWSAIHGWCNCAQQMLGDRLWRDTAAGDEAVIYCAANAVGTPSSRPCGATGLWGTVVEGECNCPAGTWTNFVGSQYEFEETAAMTVATVPCLDGNGNLTRMCDARGAWKRPVGCAEPVFCPAETVDQLTFNSTEGGSTVMIMCAGISSMSYGRVCREDGVWEDVIGYCQCAAFTDETGVFWPAMRSDDADMEADCGLGYSGRITRGCSYFGEWVEADNKCTRNMCAAQTVDGVAWPQTDSLLSAQFQCDGSSTTVSRLCAADGSWQDVVGSCSCAATTIDGVDYPLSVGGTVISAECGEGFKGDVTRLCSGLGAWEELVNTCESITCPEETYLNIEWPITLGGIVANVSCVSSAPGSNTRYCSPSGEWATAVGGSGCYCDSTSVEDNGLYIWTSTTPGTVTKDCVNQYTGTISYTCARSGGWVDLNNQCQRVQCHSETVNGIYFAATESNSTQHVACAASGVGMGYDRFCDESGVWEGDMVGECFCPKEEIRHIDGHLYSFAKTEAGSVASQVCGGDLAGSVARVCSLYGEWQPIRGQCKQLQCPMEVLDGYVWPLTNSSTTVSLPCNDFMTGQMSRTCHAAGLWSDPENQCQETKCDTVYVKRQGSGCMNIKFNTGSELPYVRVNVVPSSSPDMTIATSGQTVRLCGLEPNVAYSLFVQYCNSKNQTVCTNACAMENVYYQQTCDVMSPVDVVDVVRANGATTITFSTKFPLCPIAPKSLEIEYHCVEGCDSMDLHPVSTSCADLGGCVAGTRESVLISDDFPLEALFEVRQRMILPDEAQSYSETRTFRVRDLSRVGEVTPQLEMNNGKTVHLELGTKTTDLVLFKSHTVYIYKKKIPYGRRLVDSLFSTVKICPAAVGVCEITSTDVPVEPGYDYSFSIYSYPIVSSGKVVVSVASIRADAIPFYQVTATPGDYFIKLTLSGANYPLSGQCMLVSVDTVSTVPVYVTVSLPKMTTVNVMATDLVVESDYAITCVLADETGLENQIKISSRTLAVFAPLLSLAYVSDTTYDVMLNAVVNKPAVLHCLPTEKDVIPSESQLLLLGQVFDVTVAGVAVSVSLTLATSFPIEYRVTCVAVDLYSRKTTQTVMVTPSGTAYAPVLVSTVPADNAKSVEPMVMMKLVFKYPVTVTPCQFCFFILYNANDRSNTNLYPSSFFVTKNTISFVTPHLLSDTTYQLKVSTRGLITDSTNGAVFEPGTDVLITFSVKKYSSVTADVLVPRPGDFFPVNGIIEVSFDNYMKIGKGNITINSLTIPAESKCIQLLHPLPLQTLLRIPVVDCVGVLRSESSYIMVFPQALLLSADYVMSPRVTAMFQTEAKSFSPAVIGSFPPHLEDEVPLDVAVKLYFDQSVTFGDGFVFISEYIDQRYVNSYNLPASKAQFSNTFPYEVSWESYLFSLKPQRRYVLSWSKGVVVNAYGDAVPASTMNENIEFWTASTGCSPNYIADRIDDIFMCTYEDDICQCQTSTVTAMTQKKHV